MSEAKIRLSEKEMEIVNNAELILTKNAVLQKINQLLAGLQVQQYEHINLLKEHLPVEWQQASPKISKGENYQGLPYLVLDYPRFFSNEGILAVRTMFWWGNFFSVTLHVAGSFKQQLVPVVIEKLNRLGEAGFYLSVNEEQWEHHFEQDNYKPIAELPIATRILNEAGYFKLAHKISFDHWEEIEERLMEYFKQLVDCVIVYPPRR